MTSSSLSVLLQARLVALRRNRRMLTLAPFDTTSTEGRSNERYRRASLSAATSAAAKGIALVTTAVSVPLTLGYLGSERFGVWMTLSALVALLGFTDLGIGNSLLNGVAHAAGRGDRALIRANISSGIAMLLALAVGFGLVFAAVYQIVPWDRVFNVGSAAAVGEVGPAAAALVVCFLVGLPAGAFAQVRLGLQEGYVNSVFVGAGNIAGLAFVLIAVAMQLGLPWLVLAMAGGPLLATFANGFALIVRSEYLRPALRAVDYAIARSLLHVGLLFLVLQLAVAVAFTSNSIILAAMLGPSAVADYAVVSKLFMIPTLLVGFALGPLWPAYREALSRGDVQWVRSTFRRSIRLSLLVAGLVSTVLVVLGIPLIALWVGPSSIHPSFGLILAMGIWTTIGAVGNAVAMLLNGAQVMRFQVVSAVLMSSANVLLSIWLTTRVGVSGVVWGSIIAYSVFAMIPVVFYLPRLFVRIDRAAAPVGASE
jgi:O-antigen/teichoic acid export membrane protein